jgi:hypothetical protein
LNSPYVGFPAGTSPRTIVVGSPGGGHPPRPPDLRDLRRQLAQLPRQGRPGGVNNGPFTEQGNRYQGEVTADRRLTFEVPARFEYALDAERIKVNADGTISVG